MWFLNNRSQKIGIKVVEKSNTMCLGWNKHEKLNKRFYA